MARRRRCVRCGADLDVTSCFCGRCGTRQASTPASGAAPPGWYRDPFGRADYRLWNGEIWTASVYADGYGEDVLSLDYAPVRRSAWSATPGSLALSLSGLVVAFGLSLVFSLPYLFLGHPGGAPVVLLLSETGLWTGLVGTCILTSRRYGTGSLRRDFRITVRWLDLPIGLGAMLVARVVAIAVAIPFAFGRRLTHNPDGALYALAHLGVFGWLVLALVTCVGAPLFEELFFRGLLQGQLAERYGAPVAITLTAIVFGAAHFGNDPGYGGLVLAVVIGTAGVVLGLVRHLTGRLGTSMATHALFNTSAVALLAAASVLGGPHT